MTDPDDWRYVYASVSGVAHLAEGSDCQDACAVERLSVPEIGPVLVLAAADGAGSATHARIGAELACRTLLAECAACLPDIAATDWAAPLAETLFLGVRSALAHHASDTGVPLRELACTLLGAVVADQQALFLQIGDGAIVIDTGTGYHPVFWPQSGEYANETRFVTDADALTWLQHVVITDPINEIAILTDGLQWLALHYQQRQAHAPFFRSLFERLREHPEPGCPASLITALERFLASPAINQRTHDDKTLILATRWSLEIEASAADLPPNADEQDLAALADPPASTETIGTAAPDAPEQGSTTESPNHPTLSPAPPDSRTRPPSVRDSHGDDLL